jgi:tripartite ATP-independent transporter DctP family solute receptor
MSNIITRRAFVAGATLGSASLLFNVRAQPRAEFRFIQYHNQTAESSLHQRLAEMWTAVGAETGGRVAAQVFPLNNQVPGSDPAALKMLVGGEIHFFTLMGGVLGQLVPVAEVQQVPFAFRSAEHAHEAMDGALGAFIREEMAAQGIHGFQVGAFDNGMRQMTLVPRPITVPADLKGIRMRVPAAQMSSDLFEAFGATPVVFNSIDIYPALKSGKVDAQENPLALADLFKLYEVVKYVSMTNHMWSGFNQMAHLPTWRALPADIRQIIDRHVTGAVRLQRQDQAAANGRLRAELTGRGLAFNDIDQAPFRRQLSGFYATWKGRLGARCWSLLEEAAGSTLA